MKEPTTAIILVAGQGTRLGLNTPKSLVNVGGEPLIYYAIRFVKETGVERIVVVGGFEFQRVKQAVKDFDRNIDVYENSEYVKGNILSVQTGLTNIKNGGFLLYHGDHFFKAAIAKRVSTHMNKSLVMFTDTDRLLSGDDMKIVVDERNFVRKLSKKLTQYSHGYVGITYCDAKTVPSYAQALDEVIKTSDGKASSEEIVQYLIDKNNQEVCIGDLSGVGWFEVDYPEELKKFESEIATNRSLYF